MAVAELKGAGRCKTCGAIATVGISENGVRPLGGGKCGKCGAREYSVLRFRDDN